MDAVTQEQKTTSPIDGLHVYATTESFNSIINSLMAYYSGQLVRPRIQTEEFTNYCRKMRDELRDVNNDTSITNNLEKMESYIGKYGPILKNINNGVING